MFENGEIPELREFREFGGGEEFTTSPLNREEGDGCDGVGEDVTKVETVRLINRWNNKKGIETRKPLCDG